MFKVCIHIKTPISLELTCTTLGEKECKLSVKCVISDLKWMVQNEMIEVRIKSERSQNIIKMESKSMQVDVKRNMYC